MSKRTELVFPFSAIVGQKQMKMALLLNAINPKIGGVLIRGEKGTAKSMAVRSLARLLPEIEVVADCPFRCDPGEPDRLCDRCVSRIEAGEKLETVKRQVRVVDLPIGATEDRVTGTLDIERAIKSGEKHFDPGLLAAVNRGILYVDEINLLDDHLVDILLDAAAMGVNFVEREGISFSHPAEFILVGTMNPEEGELRPQLLDRFGLAVEIKGIQDRNARADIVSRRLAFEDDAAAFAAKWEKEQESLRQRIEKAKQLLPGVKLDCNMLDLITTICVDFAVDGHRADIVIYKTACTLAAFRGHPLVNQSDIKEAAQFALLHRQRRQPFDKAHLQEDQLEKSIDSWQQKKEMEEEREEEEASPDSADIHIPDGSKKGKSQSSPGGDQPEDSGDGGFSFSPTIEGDMPLEGETINPDDPYRVKQITTPILDEMSRKTSGRRSVTRSDTGRYIDSEIPRGKVSDLAFDATVRAAAPHQLSRKASGEREKALYIEKHDLRQKVREKKSGNLIVFVLDSSGSMAKEVVATKTAILSMMLDAYQRRDHIGLITFCGGGAYIILPPTKSVELAQQKLPNVWLGGRSPLTHALVLAQKVITEELQRKKEFIPMLVLVSDGKGNVSLKGGDPHEEAKEVAREIRQAGIHALCIDTEKQGLSHLMQEICQEMGGLYLRPEDLKAESIATAVKSRLR